MKFRVDSSAASIMFDFTAEVFVFVGFSLFDLLTNEDFMFIQMFVTLKVTFVLTEEEF